MNAVAPSGTIYVDDKEIGKVKDVTVAVVGDVNTRKLAEAVKALATGKVEITGEAKIEHIDQEVLKQVVGPKPWAAKEATPLMMQLMEVGNAQVRECGHNMDPRSLPKKRNCQHCWFAYFLSHPPVVAAAKVTFGNTALTYAEKKTTITRSITDKGFRFVEEFISQLEQYEAQKAAQDAAELAKAKEQVAEIVSQDPVLADTMRQAALKYGEKGADLG